jgi:hypothetical protein
VAVLTGQFGSTLHVKLNATLSGALNVTVQPQASPEVGRDLHRPDVRLAQRIVTRHTAGFTLTTSANNIQVTKQ